LLVWDAKSCSLFRKDREKIFSKVFQKHPPRIVSHFKQVKGLLFFVEKYPPIFSLPGSNK